MGGAPASLSLRPLGPRRRNWPVHMTGRISFAGRPLKDSLTLELMSELELTSCHCWGKGGLAPSLGARQEISLSNGESPIGPAFAFAYEDLPGGHTFEPPS